MAYLGRQPVVGNFVKLDAITTSATATYNLLNGGVAYFPQTANNCIVSLNGVIQSPTSAYTISGSTIVFSDALTSSDTIDFILVLGDVLSIGTPSDGTITSAKLASGTAGLISWQSVVTASTLTAVAGRGYFIDTTSNACTVTFPSSPTIGDTIAIVDYAGTSATNKITLNANGNKIDGSSINKTIQTNKQAIIITYSDVTRGWVLSSASLEGTLGIAGVPGAPTIGTATSTLAETATVPFTAPSDNGGSTITSYTATSSPGGITGTISQSGSGTITVSGLSSNTSYTFTVTATNSSGTSAASSASNSITTPNSYSINFLVIAGGGGAGGGSVNTGGTGGGGAGGYRTSTQSIIVGNAITVTVGNGGTGGTTSGSNGTNGSNSSISGSGLTTITSAGGGGGANSAASPAIGNSGGSGGGGSYSAIPGGLGNTPSTSPSQGNSGGNGISSANYSGGGGGGSGSVGANGEAGSGGNGGSGTASSITGSSVTRAGGGGGGTYSPATGGTGQAGGGNGGASADGTAATANTGSGGGGSGCQGAARDGGAGGKGVVILSVPTAKYSSTTTGSPTVTTSGSNTILQFNGSGSYTA